MEEDDTEAPHTGHEEDILSTSILPPDLAEFLKDQTFACLTWPTDRGTVLLIKAPGHEIETLRGRLPIQVRHELFEHQTAPVIRLVVTFYDQPARPLAVESFINVEDPQQRADFAALVDQQELDMLLYDETLTHRLTKRVGYTAGEQAKLVLERADSLFHAIPQDRFSFETAKAWVMANTTM